MRFICRYCSNYQSVLYRRLISHIWSNHSLDADFKVVCDINGCLSRFTGERSFVRHIRKKHVDFFRQHMKNHTDTINEISQDLNNDELNHELEVIDEPMFQLDQTDQNISNLNDESPGENDFEDQIADFLLELKEIHHVTNSAASFVCQKFVNILIVDRQQLSNRLRKSLSENNINFQIDYESEMILNTDSPYRKPLEKLSNIDTLRRYIENKDEYVKPKEIEIEANTASSNKQEACFYIPIEKTLTQYLKHDDVLNDILSYPHHNDISLITSFADGQCYKNNKLFSNHQNSLQLILYHDDFQIVNPLGNKTNKFKVSAFYFVVGNVQSEHRSRLQDIHLLLLCNASYLKKNGYAKILKPVMDDIKRLETQGFEILHCGLRYEFYASVSMIIADNLAAHALGGYFQNFSTVDRFCRVCDRSKKDISKVDLIDNIRTVSIYDQQLRDVLENEACSKLYGIKESCCLNELKYFHIVDGAPPDIAHDIFEGFAVDFVSALVIYMIKSKIANLGLINQIILNFQYESIDKRNQPQPIKEKPLSQLKVKQTACEMWNLLRLFPLMVGDLFQKDDKFWELFGDFVEMVCKLCAVKFSEESINELDDIIPKFLQKYLSFFPDESLKPKAHFLLHYPLNIRKFGPLVKTLRFESKNGALKSSIKGSHNFVNVCLSMAKHHQMLSYLNHRKPEFFSSHQAEPVSVCDILFKDLEIPIQDLIQQHMGNYQPQYIAECKSVRWCGQYFHQNCAIIIGSERFGKVIKIYLINKVPFFHCQILEKGQFNKHYQSFEVDILDLHLVICAKDLYDYHPLSIYCLRAKSFIPLHHHVI